MAGLVGLSLCALLFEPLASVVVALDLVLVICVISDFLRTPHPASLDVRRSIPDRVGLSQEFVRVVRVQGGVAGLRLELFEEFSTSFRVRARTVLDAHESAVETPPDAIAAPGRWWRPAEGDPSGGADVCVLPASGPIDLARVYTSSIRGVHAVGDMRVRITGPLGLVRRQARLFGEQTLRVEPALLNLKNTLRLAASERWHDLGVRHLRRKGGVTEFESMRDYVAGDEVRSVDWKAFAKRGRPIVRQYQEERGQELILLIDRGRRMSATTAIGAERGWTKLDHAVDAALQLAAVALERGDRVGLATYSQRLEHYIPPVRGGKQFGRLREAVFDVNPEVAESSLRRALFELGVRHRRRAMVVIVSDVADPLSVEHQRQALSSASRRHRVIFASLDDPSVRRTAESKDGKPELRATALHQVVERNTSLRELASSGARVLDTLPAEAAAPLLAAWLDARRSG